MDVLASEELLQRRIDALRGELERLLSEAREMNRALAQLTGEAADVAAAKDAAVDGVVDESYGHGGEY